MDSVAATFLRESGDVMILERDFPRSFAMSLASMFSKMVR